MFILPPAAYRPEKPRSVAVLADAAVVDIVDEVGAEGGGHDVRGRGIAYGDTAGQRRSGPAAMFLVLRRGLKDGTHAAAVHVGEAEGGAVLTIH